MFFEFARDDSLRMTGESSDVSVLHERFESALRNAAMTWRQAVECRLRRLGMSWVCWMTISAAAQARTPLSQSNLADMLAISRASMVHTIDRLVKDGLVKRESSASDRRLKRILVTDAGMHCYFLIRGKMAVVRREMLAIVELERLIHLTELLETLQESFRPSSGSGLLVSKLQISARPIS
jgi:MarR family transcriptional regulator, transcriptional regulator for hemolysin